MIKKQPKLLIRLIALLTLTLGLVYASTVISTQKEKATLSYKDMSTTQLQIEVEKLSNEGKLPFEMGLELMKRWQTEKPTVY